MASVLALLVFFAVIALLLRAGWVTERSRRPSDGEPSLAEHAAADAGRVGAAAAVGSHDAVVLGSPTSLNAVARADEPRPSDPVTSPVDSRHAAGGSNRHWS